MARLYAVTAMSLCVPVRVHTSSTDCDTAVAVAAGRALVCARMPVVRIAPPSDPPRLPPAAQHQISTRKRRDSPMSWKNETRAVACGMSALRPSASRSACAATGREHRPCQWASYGSRLTDRVHLDEPRPEGGDDLGISARAGLRMTRRAHLEAGDLGIGRVRVQGVQDAAAHCGHGRAED